MRILFFLRRRGMPGAPAAVPLSPRFERIPAALSAAVLLSLLRRKRLLPSLLVALLLSLAPSRAAPEEKGRQEKDFSPRLPRVLIIGDSISMGYTPFVKRFLFGLAEVEHNPGNAGDTWRGLENLDAWLGGDSWDVIHFNWGLWDLCRRNPDSKTPGRRDKERGKLTSTPGQYEKNLRTLTSRLEKTGAKLIFASTTPVPPEEAGRCEGDAARYNEAALKIMKEHGVPVDDLFAPVKARGMGLFKGKGNVHFKPEGYRLLGMEAAKAILRALGEKKPESLLPRLVPYKKTKDAKGREVVLALHGFFPGGWSASDRRGAIVFFFGGGWNSGAPSQFYPFCRALARRGMAAFSAEYRVRSRHGTSPLKCVEDAGSALRCVRGRAAELGVDPGRIAAGGGSAGGHLAACTAMIPDCVDPADDKSVSPVPQAIVLFNPVLDTTRFGNLQKTLGAGAERISPFHHVRPGLPPVLLFHGTEDETVPFAEAEAFVRAMKKAGDTVEFVPAEGVGHGFFNFGRHGNRFFEKDLKELVRFLAGLGFFENRAGAGSDGAGTGDNRHGPGRDRTGPIRDRTGSIRDRTEPGRDRTEPGRDRP